MRVRRLILVLAAVTTMPLLAQTPQRPDAARPEFRTGTDLVEVDVIARDKNGLFVSDLALEDFELQEDGKPYAVQQVYVRLAVPAGSRSGLPGAALSPGTGSAPNTGRPNLFVVVFDDAHMSLAGFKRAQAAALTLFQSQLRDGDIGGVVSNGRMANGRLTSDRAELIKAVKDAKPSGKTLSDRMDEQLWPRLAEIEAVRIIVNNDQEMFDIVTRRACDEDRAACNGPAGDDVVRGTIQAKAVQFSNNVRVEATKTLAMLQSVLTGLARLEGPKSVLLMSEGFISEETWPDVRDTVSNAARSGTRIYALDARGSGRGLTSIESVAPSDTITRMYEQMDSAADSINSLAVDTAGFVVRNQNQFDRAIAQIADDAANYYVLGYLPPSPADGKFHRIRVSVKRPGISIRSRRGYTATPRPGTVATMPPAVSGVEPGSPPSVGSASTSGVAAATADIAPASDPDVVSGFNRTQTTSSESDTSSVRLKPDTTYTSATSTASPSTIRVRPDASKHIDLLLPDPSADRAAAAGWEAYQRGDVETARASLRVAAASPVAEAWVHYALGQSEYALGEYAPAVRAWERVRAQARTFEPVYFDLVDGYLQLKQHDKAILLLREGASNWPKDPDIFNALGVVQTTRGAVPDAIASFKEAVRVAPGEAVSYFNLGRAFELRYFRTRRYNRQTQRWIADERDRTAATEQYERYLAFGGPYADAAREGITRLKWAATGQ
jgi:VWFA-related protein